MSDWKQIAKGVVLTVMLSSAGKAMAQTFSKVDALAEKVKKEVKFTAPEVSKEEMASFEIAQPQEFAGEILQAKKPIMRDKSTWETFNLSVVPSRDTAEKMKFSDGTVATISYGYVNGRSMEEPVLISIKRPGDKARTVMTLADDLNYGTNTSGKDHLDMRHCMYMLQSAKASDLKSDIDYSNKDRVRLSNKLQTRLNDIQGQMKEIIKVGRTPMDNFKNNRFSMQMKSSIDVSQMQSQALVK